MKKIVVSCLLLIIVSLTSLAQVKSFRKTGFGLSCMLTKGVMNIYLLKPDLVEVKFTSLPQLEAKHSLVVLPQSNTASDFAVSNNNSSILITTSRLKISIDKATAAITYSDLQGKIVLAEAGSSGKEMRDTTIADISTFSCATVFQSPTDEALFGLGCHPEDSLSINYKGRNQDMAIKYLTGAIPVMLSTRGYGILWDNYAESKFFGGEAGNTAYRYVSESGKMVDYYFFYGPSFDHIIDMYRKITGPAPMYPKWAYGLFQSQDRYKTQQEVLAPAAEYRKQHIPVDAIVQDWYYWFPLPMGSHVMYPEAYPNPKAMVDELHAENFHGMISIWPCFGPGSANFKQLLNAGNMTSVTWDNFVSHTRDTYYDAHSPKAREMYWQQARDSLVKRYGWDGWWVDQCEPDTEDPNTRKKADFFTGKGIDYFNSYSLMHTQGLYEKWRRDIPGKRIFLLARQAFAGQQRNAATLWSSDITTTFPTLRNQVPQAINTCSSGIPYWTSDIGGYISRTSPGGVPDWKQPVMRELFVRWFQFGAFSPIFRIHGRGERALFSSNWDDQTKKVLLEYDNLRYRLLPYTYSVAARVTIENYTMMRSLAFDFREDANVHSIPDQYLFGPSFMVNPVTEQQYAGRSDSATVKSRKVYLPKGVEWFDFWTGVKSAGGQTLTVKTPLSIMPLYVKAGSIVPMGPRVEYATQRKLDSLELRIYPGADGSFTLYEDADNTYNYEKGEYAKTTFTWNDKTRTLSISATKGSFPGMLKKRIVNVVVVGEGHGVGEGLSGSADKIVIYTNAAQNISLR